MSRKKLNPPYRVKRFDYMGETALYISEISSEELLMYMTVEEKHLNTWEISHGGVLFALADMAAGHLTVESSGKACVTLSGNINFLKPVYPGKLEALARIDHIGKTSSVVQVDITQNEKLVSVATFTFHILSDRPIKKRISE